MRNKSLLPTTTSGRNNERQRGGRESAYHLVVVDSSDVGDDTNEELGGNGDNDEVDTSASNLVHGSAGRDGLLRMSDVDNGTNVSGAIQDPKGFASSSEAVRRTNGEDDDDDYDDDVGSFVTAVDPHSTSPRRSFARWCWWTLFQSQQTIFPDDCIQLRGTNLAWAEGDYVVKLFKFTVLTYGGIVAVFHVVRWMKWENDETLRLADVWRYEGTLIFTDVVTFFVVGRLYRQIGVDHVAWLVWCTAANVYSSYLTDFSMFRHSFTPYEMHCTWPWQLWVFLLLVIPIVATVGVWHVQYAWNHNILVQKVVEILFCLTFLLLPLVTSPYFHFHHWLAGLIVGMHLNYDTWWSRASMAWCWGQYINGIAVYGRDPALTCDYAYFMSKTQRCPYIECYLDALADPNHLFDNVTVEEMKPPNWRNCSADAYHP